MTDRAVAADREGYVGVCVICGHRGLFDVSAERRPLDREFRCEGCGHMLRTRDEAQVLIDEYGDGRQLTIDELLGLPAVQDLRVYFVGSIGPVRERLRRLPHYVESRYEPDVALGAALEDQFVNQDLSALTFADASFDLVFSSHVMEHVAEPWAAFAEIHRVLRPGGRMIHSIPTRFPLNDTTVVRAELVDSQVRHLLDERYHTSPEGRPALVFSDFGADLRPRLEEMGFEISVRRPHLPVDGARRNVVVVGRKAG